MYESNENSEKKGKPGHCMKYGSSGTHKSADLKENQFGVVVSGRKLSPV